VICPTCPAHKTKKYFALSEIKIVVSFDHPAPSEQGTYAQSSRNVVLDAMDANALPDEQRECGGQCRVVLIPRRWDQVGKMIRRRRWLQGPVHRGERGISRKTIAQGMPDRSACLW
jgi:hypothetical protein